VIATGAGGPLEIIHQGEGILVAPRNPQALANAIRSIEPLREQMAHEARLRVEKDFDMETTIPKVEVFYRTL